MALSREDVIYGYRLILGRDPESEEVIEAHRALPDLAKLREVMLNSEEFRNKYRPGVSEEVWVCAESAAGKRIWLNLADRYVSAGCLSGNYEPWESAFVRDNLKEGDCFLDIGANIGWFTLLAASRVGSEGKVIAIEPRSDSYRYLVRSICENHLDHIVEHHRCVLSNVNGYLEIGWEEGTDNPGHTQIVSAAQETPGMIRERVQAVRLDDLMNGRRCDFIKIDVEGAEPLVFEGAENLLRTSRPIILSELFPEQLQEVSGVSDRDYIGMMKAFGYRCHLLTEHGVEKEKELLGFPEGYARELASVVFLPE